LLGRQSAVAAYLMWLGILIIVAFFILGLSLGKANVGLYVELYERAWPATFIWWGSGLVSGSLFIALSEIVEHLRGMRAALQELKDQDEFELIRGVSGGS